MTIASETNQSGPYVLNGVTTTFQYGFKINDAAHLQVVQSSGGTDTILTTGFTVTNVKNNAGGDVVFTTPLTSGTLTLLLNVPFTQLADYATQSTVDPQQIEDDLDAALQRDLTMRGDIARSLQISVGQAALSVNLPALLPGEVLRLNDAGTAFEGASAPTSVADVTAVSVTSFAAIATSDKITSGTKIVHVTNGYHGDGGIPFSMRLVNGTPQHEIGVQHTATGIWFEPLPVLGFLGVHTSGARGRAQFRHPSTFVLYEDSGFVTEASDDQVPCQKVIDAVGHSNSYTEKVWIPPGWFRLDRTLANGYGIGFASTSIHGSGQGFRGEEQFGGSQFRATFSDRMIINNQGGRNPINQDFDIEGFADVSTFNGGPSTYMFTESNWNAMVDLDGAAVATGRYNQYAAVTTDAFCGVAPAGASPEPVPPTWVDPSPTSYGKLQSSNFSLIRVSMAKTFAGLVVQPADFDGNSDFTKVQDCAGEMMKVFLAVCNTQSRNFHIATSEANRIFYGIATNQFGRQVGHLGGVIQDLSFAGSVFRALESDGTSLIGTTTWTNFLFESGYEVMNLNGASSNDVEMIFINPTFKLTGQDPDGEEGTPSAVWRGGCSGRVRHIGGSITSHDLFAYSELPNISFLGTRFNSTMSSRADMPLSQAMAHNATLGFYIDNNSHDCQQDIRVRRFNLNTGAIDGLHECYNDGSFHDCDRETGLPLWVQRYRLSGENAAGYIHSQRYVGLRERPKTDFSSITVNNDVLTLVFNSTQSIDEAAQYGFTKGSIVKDDATNTMFVIESWNGTDTIVARAHTNIRQQASSVATVTGITQANPAVVTANNSFVNGELITLKSVAGMTDVVNKQYLVANRSATTFELNDLDGNAVDSTSFGAYTSGGTAARRELIEAISTSVGNVSFVQCGVYVPNVTCEYVYASASTTVNVTYRGNNRDLTGQVVPVTDHLYDGFMGPLQIHDGARSQITAVASGTLTIGTGGARRNHTTLEQLFMRPAA